jgi:transposase
MHLMHKRAELLSPIQNTTPHYTLPERGKKIAYKANREGVAERFAEGAVQQSIEVDLALIDHYDKVLNDVERYIVNTAKQHAVNAFYRLRSVPGIGQILALVILYEVQDSGRFPRVQDFVSYGRRVKCTKESAGKK